MIDGGISKAYRVKTGIAGYTLIYDSHSLRLAEHKPYDGEGADITPKVSIVEKMERRVCLLYTSLKLKENSLFLHTLQAMQIKLDVYKRQR